MIHKFKYYLHDGYEQDETVEFIMGQIPELNMGVEQFRNLVGQPFYEVTLHCLFDDVTGEVTIVAAEL